MVQTAVREGGGKKNRESVSKPTSPMTSGTKAIATTCYNVICEGTPNTGATLVP